MQDGSARQEAQGGAQPGAEGQPEAETAQSAAKDEEVTDDWADKKNPPNKLPNKPKQPKEIKDPKDPDYVDPDAPVLETEGGYQNPTDDEEEVITFYLGEYTVDVGETWNWPLGVMPVDIKYVNDGIPRHTSTFRINVLKGLS